MSASGPDPAPLPRLARLLAAAPLLAISAGTGRVAATLCGCESTDHLRRSLSAWRDQLDGRHGGMDPERIVRELLRPAPAGGRRVVLPFADLRRDVFSRLGPETRRVLHRHALRQTVEHPDAPIPEWINDYPNRTG